MKALRFFFSLRGIISSQGAYYIISVNAFQLPVVLLESLIVKTHLFKALNTFITLAVKTIHVSGNSKSFSY